MSGKSDNDKVKGKPEFRCIECGHEAAQLYRDFNHGIIKISHCVNCSDMVDKYIEFDRVIIFLDALLHKPQAYRHILFNEKFRAPTRLLLIFMLCDSYLKWETHRPKVHQNPKDYLFYATLETDFYKMFAISLFEWCIFSLLTCLSFYLMAMCVPSKQSLKVIICQSTCQSNSMSLLRWGLVVSSFGKLLALPAILWGQANSAYTFLASIFIFTSNVSAVKVIYPFGRTYTTMVLLMAHSVQFLVGNIMYNWVTDENQLNESQLPVTTYLQSLSS